ncbi:MAG: ABC transporter permease subunit [Planctomycetota bacterium]
MLVPLILLAVVLLPGWGGHDYVLRLLLSPTMLAGLAMLTALRVGVVDLSVWVVADFAALITCALLLRGVDPATAMAAALATGAAVGAVNALLTVCLRVASPASTLAVAIALMLVLRIAVGEELALPTTDRSTALSPYDASIVLATMTYVLVLVGITLISVTRAGKHLTRNWKILLVSCVAAAIASAAGICGLIDTSRATVPWMPVGELRIPAAALLAGSAIFAGKRGGTTSVLCLPPALLIATVWLLNTYPLWLGGYYLHVGGLVIMTIGSQALLKRSLDTPRLLSSICSAAAIFGMLLVALTARTTAPGIEALLTAAGWAIFILAVVAAVLSPRRAG